MKHAGPVTDVSVDINYEPTSLTLSIHDDGTGTTGPDRDGPHIGHGLVGMRERVEQAGGCLVAGPLRLGGYSVTATFPVEIG